MSEAKRPNFKERRKKARAPTGTINTDTSHVTVPATKIQNQIRQLEVLRVIFPVARERIFRRSHTVKHLELIARTTEVSQL